VAKSPKMGYKTYIYLEIAVFGVTPNNPNIAAESKKYNSA
jgi:hypothetical protein